MTEPSRWRTTAVVPAMPGYVVTYLRDQPDVPVIAWLLQEAVDLALVTSGDYPDGTRVVAGILDRYLGEIVPVDGKGQAVFNDVVAPPMLPLPPPPGGEG